MSEPWDLFDGSDSSDDDNGETTLSFAADNTDNKNKQHPTASFSSQQQQRQPSSSSLSSVLLEQQANDLTLFLVTSFFLSLNGPTSLDKCVVMFVTNNSNNSSNNNSFFLGNLLQTKFRERGLCCCCSSINNTNGTLGAGNEWYDAVVVVTNHCGDMIDHFLNKLIPGGLLLIFTDNNSSNASSGSTTTILDPLVWKKVTNTMCNSSFSSYCKIYEKRKCLINTSACLWKARSQTMIDYELDIASKATILRSAYDRSQPYYSLQCVNKEMLSKAVQMLLKYGFVILPQLFPVDDVGEWATALLQDFHDADEALKTRGIYIRQPGAGKDPPSFHELAMREDFRCDLRNGRAIKRQQQKSCAKLRTHPAVSSLIKTAFNPKGQHYKGNFGRWNFEGEGPTGKPMPLKVGEVGGVISLPGATDQAIHADCRHCFEHIDLPPHYANLFVTPSLIHHHQDEQQQPSSAHTHNNNGSSLVGGTAFIAGSHRLQECARFMKDSNREERIKNIIRPSLNAGDALIFDCRVLHFGLANRSESTIRPLMYINYTHEWFIDPKNWNDRERLFADVDQVATGGGLIL